MPVEADRRIQARALDELEQDVARADVGPPLSLDHDRRPRAADAGIGQAEKDGSLGKDGRIGG